MNAFQKTVLTISVFVLIISLIILGIFLSKSLLEESYPPIISDCPDYWDVSYSDVDKIDCINNSTINSGNGTIDCREFPVIQFKTGEPHDILCEKYKWSKKCGIHWDGVTNNSKACDLEYY